MAILAAALLLSACTRSAGPDPETNTNANANAADGPTRPDFFFLDVCSLQEIAELGTLPGYVNIPIGELEGRLAEIPPGMAIVTA